MDLAYDEHTVIYNYFIREFVEIYTLQKLPQ